MKPSIENWTIDKIVAENIGNYENPYTKVTIFLRCYTCDKYVKYEMYGVATEDLDTELLEALDRYLKYSKKLQPQYIHRKELSKNKYWDEFEKSP